MLIRLAGAVLSDVEPMHVPVNFTAAIRLAVRKRPRQQQLYDGARQLVVAVFVDQRPSIFVVPGQYFRRPNSRLPDGARRRLIPEGEVRSTTIRFVVVGSAAAVRLHIIVARSVYGGQPVDGLWRCQQQQQPTGRNWQQQLFVVRFRSQPRRCVVGIVVVGVATVSHDVLVDQRVRQDSILSDTILVAGLVAVNFQGKRLQVGQLVHFRLQLPKRKCVSYI
jgi:hypothetical protein